jgi:hypothetical protein
MQQAPAYEDTTSTHGTPHFRISRTEHNRAIRVRLRECSEFGRKIAAKRRVCFLVQHCRPLSASAGMNVAATRECGGMGEMPGFGVDDESGTCVTNL